MTESTFSSTLGTMSPGHSLLPSIGLTRVVTRWVLIAFKREFPFNDVLRLWEVLWTDYYTTDFVLFVALAVLESHRDVILRYLIEVSYFTLPRLY